MVVDKDQLFYKFDHKRRGTAVIFNHEIFDVQHLGKRNGTNADRDNLESCLRRLGFEVIIHNNLTAEGVMDEVEKCD
jgi:caspase 6